MAPTADSSAPSPPPTILVIDDDPEVLEMITDLLAEAGLEVLTAGSGAQGLELAAARQPPLGADGRQHGRDERPRALPACGGANAQSPQRPRDD